MLGWLRKLLRGPGAGGSTAIPPKARALHQEGREAGSASDYARALACFEHAQALAPDWPHPTYDMAFSYLLQGDFDNALKAYEKVEAMAEKGFFFTNQTAVWALRGERDGWIPKGTYLAYMMIEWAENPPRRLEIARQVAERAPTFAPAWLSIAKLAGSAEEREQAMAKCLELECDALTRDTAQFTHAGMLIGAGKKEEAAAIYKRLATSPETVPSIKAFAALSANAGAPPAGARGA